MKDDCIEHLLKCACGRKAFWYGWASGAFCVGALFSLAIKFL